MRRSVIILLLLFFASMPVAGQPTSQLAGQTSINMSETGDIAHQLELYQQTTKYLDEIFQQFSEGYLFADPALKKVSVLKHEYEKQSQPVPPETQRLHELMKQLLSQVENYFIYHKKILRENPELNLKIAKTTYELSMEADKLQSMYLL